MPSCPTLRIALPVPLPQTFDYLSPPDGPQPSQTDVGRRLRVPFGNRELVGMVEGVGSSDDPTALKAALEWLDPAPLLGGELLASLRWLARYTHAPLGEVVATALPAPLRRGEPLPDTHGWAWELTGAGRDGLPGLRNGTRPQRLATLLAGGALAEEVIEARMHDWREPSRALLKRGFVQRVAVPATAPQARPNPGPAPNPQQQAAIEAITAADGFHPFLLDGVTGSGKTEVYLQAIVHCLEQGRQALVLVPEIGLTPQMLARFRARLGIPVHALHSGLNDNERARGSGRLPRVARRGWSSAPVRRCSRHCRRPGC